MNWTPLVVILAFVAIVWLVEQIRAWREGSAILNTVEQRNNAYTCDLIRRVGAIYLHQTMHQGFQAKDKESVDAL